MKSVPADPEVAEAEKVAVDTIVAISTPPGRGGIGMVRLSGPRAAEMGAAMVRLRHSLEHAQARFGEIYAQPEAGTADQAEEPARLDECVVTYFAGPRSYTGEDLVEIAAHGSPVVLELLVRMALAQGARVARPGEFTERAFLSGRMDLTQAEAVRDLIDAQTVYQARVAAEQMGGALSRRVQPVKQALVELIALLEAGIDFAEDDVDVTPQGEIVTKIDTIAPGLEELAGSFERGRLVHNGLTLAIVGRPNVGKSSLFNRLLERERAIVTAIPGTTRDLVTERLAVGGIPVEVVDTAGLRAGADEVETIGIEKSREALADANLVLVVTEAGVPLSEEERELLKSLGGRQVLVVRNKCDVATEDGENKYVAVTGANMRWVRTSAITGEGLDALRSAVLEMVRGAGDAGETGMLTTLRHHEAVKGALGGLRKARAAAESGIPHEMVLLDLYEALRALDSLTGETTADDILNRIFSTFCIGK